MSELAPSGSRGGGGFSDWGAVPRESSSVHAPREASQHKTSEFLRNRHPYRGEPEIFFGQVHPFEVAAANLGRAVPKFAALLAVPNLPDAKRLEALELLHEALSDQERKAVAVEQGAVATCTALLESEHAGIREFAAKVVGSCAALMAGRSAVAAAEALVPLVALLTDGEVAVREAAAAALASVSASRDGARHLLRSQESVLLYLVAALFDPASGDGLSSGSSLPLVLSTTNTLAHLTKLIGGESVDKALAAGAVGRLVTLLEPSSAPFVGGELRVAVLRCLWNLSLAEQGKSPVIKGGAVPLIIKAVSDATTAAPRGATAAAVRRNGSGALLSLSVDEECKLLLQEPKAVECVVRLIYDRGDDLETPGGGADLGATRKNAISTVHQVCESPAGLAAYTKALVVDEPLLIEVLAERAAQPLADLLLPGAKKKLRAHAVEALLLLTAEPQAAPGDPSGPGQPVAQYLVGGWSAGVMQVVHIVERLAACCKDPGCRESAHAVLRNLADNSPRATEKIKKLVAEKTLKEEEFPDL